MLLACLACAILAFVEPPFPLLVVLPFASCVWVCFAFQFAYCMCCGDVFGTITHIRSCCDHSADVPSSAAAPTDVRVDSGKKRHVCSVCDKGFTWSSSLTRHMRTHTGEKPFVCGVCDKGFTEKSHLTRHMRTHTGKKPFVCSVCDKGFTQNGSLTNHMRTHTGEKPFVCSVCDKGFAQNNSLTRHMQTHYA